MGFSPHNVPNILYQVKYILIVKAREIYKSRVLHIKNPPER